MTSEIIGLFLENPRSLNGTSALIPTFQACLPLVKLDQEVTGINDTIKANAVIVLGEMIQGIRAAQEHGISIGTGPDSALQAQALEAHWVTEDPSATRSGRTR
ncbi:hypothetical protein ACFYYB_33870 [Streptomyces sp. NPDC002886]|uniref:hypothetical protein n=1 Tax=Streptomyces sp. NPDC002886 TaxID=3364667 RepID=UPI003681ECBA